jgi:hypothetical protein
MEEITIYITVPGKRMAGLMSYFIQAVSNLNAIDNTSNKMYIKYDHDMLYLDSTRKEKNVWDYFFEQPFTFNDVEINHAKRVKEVWFKDGLGVPPPRPSQEFYKKANILIQKYVRLKSNIEEKINNFLIENDLQDKKFLAIHKRGTDHHTMDAEHLLPTIKPIISIDNFFKHTDEIIDNFYKVLVCTDENNILDSFKKRYGNKIVCYDSIRSLDSRPIGIHYSIGQQNPYKMGEDIITEVYLMSKAHTLMRTVSNVSISVIMLNNVINVINIDKDINYENL